MGDGEPAAILLAAMITIGAATLAGAAASKAGLTKPA
ncbi:hypothetical protein G418_12817 [Rhodococcus qingshengii BKS 20-40]|nr:hypothetical protein G418_12817 [Rhodococcus qingshengii BKS 20-40]